MVAINTINILNFFDSVSMTYLPSALPCHLAQCLLSSKPEFSMYLMNNSS